MGGVGGSLGINLEPLSHTRLQEYCIVSTRGFTVGFHFGLHGPLLLISQFSLSFFYRMSKGGAGDIAFARSHNSVLKGPHRELHALRLRIAVVLQNVS